MPIKPDSPKEKEYKVAPEGTHPARCYQIMHYGHVPNTFPGALNPWVNTIRIVWELPDEKEVFKEGEEPRPFSIAKEFTLSMNSKSNLRKLVEQWLGKKFTDEEANDFDVETLLGKPCLITIEHKEGSEGRVFANVLGVTKPLGKMIMPEPVNDTKVISWNTMTKEQLDKLPDFLQKKFKSSQEFGRWVSTQKLTDISYPTEQVNAEDIPF